MKQIAPDYYRHFACIAGACRHSCCIGWEIDVDPDSLRRYQQMEGEMGQRLRSNIDVTPDGASFRLTGYEERCPFLNADGLCDLILTLGEDALCQICTDHPRFRSFWSNRTEIGLGLCCEEAGRLVLGWKEPVRLEVLADDGAKEEAEPEENALLLRRGELIGLMQDRSLPVEERAQKLAESVGVSLDDFVWEDWLPFLLDLEMLDPGWEQMLEQLADADEPVVCDALQTPLEQWMVYLLYRHLPGAAEDGRERGRILLCLLMWLAAAQLSSGMDFARLVELCRLFSSEWEYSQQNLDDLIDELETVFES